MILTLTISTIDKVPDWVPFETRVEIPIGRKKICGKYPTGEA